VNGPLARLLDLFRHPPPAAPAHITAGKTIMTTQSVLTPFEQAALPSAVAVLQAVDAFIANMGTDPAQWQLKFPGALVTLQGAVMLEAPLLAQAEGGAVSGQATLAVGGWIKKLQALEKPAA